jgi:hypothetical protein
MEDLNAQIAQEKIFWPTIRIWSFITSLFFMVSSFSPTPNHQAGGTPIVGYP